MLPERVIDYAVSKPEQMLTLFTGLVGVAEHYRRTGRFPLGRIPYRALRQVFRELGNQYGSRPRPTGVPGILVEASVEQIETELREQAHFESGDLYSYKYQGEALNLRRPSGYRDHPTTGEPIPTELHVRCFRTETEGATWLIAHDEASRAEAWGPHIRGTLLSWTRGRDQVETVLSEVGISAERRQSEGADEDVAVIDTPV